MLKTFFGKCCIPLKERPIVSRYDSKFYSETIHLLTSSQYIPMGFNVFWDFDRMMGYYLE